MKNTMLRPFRAIRHRNYRLYWMGHLVSSTGMWVHMLALSWLVYRLSHSPVLLGAVGFASQIPIFTLAILGGVAADRFNRRKLIVAAQTFAMLQALALAGLTFTESIAMWHVFVLALGIGTATAFDIPARQAFLVEIAGRDDLMNAVALNSSAFQTARMLGPALAAVILAAGGSESLCFLLNGLSYLMMIFALAAMRLEQLRHPREPSAALMAELTAGLHFVWRERTVRYLLLFLATTSFWGVSYFALMPIFAAEILDSGPEGLGLLMSASGLGSIVGTLYVAARSSKAGPGNVRGVATGCGIGLGFALIGFASSTSLWLSGFSAAVAGALVLTLAATTNSCIQLMVPDELRGRTMSLYTVMYVGAYPFGHLLAGLVAGQTGVRVAVALAGLLALATTFSITWKLPRGPAQRVEITVGPPDMEVTGSSSRR